MLRSLTFKVPNNVKYSSMNLAYIAGKARWTMTGVSAVVKGKTMKIFINERCYVPFQLRGNMRMRLVKFKKCFIMDIIKIYMIKTKGLQKCSNSDILWTASIGWHLITVYTSLIYFVWLEYQAW
uniref:Putative ovule protein n=1 Tax=Solanum chacoense TaxID=4108 RepID=A0A0V0IJY4_SOLCH